MTPLILVELEPSLLNVIEQVRLAVITALPLVPTTRSTTLSGEGGITTE